MKAGFLLFFGLLLLWSAFTGRAADMWDVLINGPRDSKKLG